MALHKTIICSVVLIFVGLVLLFTDHRYTLLPKPRISAIGSKQSVTGDVKPRFIFVDLGANAADSLEVFLRHEGAKYEYEFPRPEWATYDQAGEFPTPTATIHCSESRERIEE